MVLSPWNVAVIIPTKKETTAVAALLLTSALKFWRIEQRSLSSLSWAGESALAEALRFAAIAIVV